MNADDNALARIVAKAWADESFKARLEADPKSTLAAEGVAVPEGVSLKVVENTASVMHLVLPAKPAEGELSDQELEGVAGGNCFCMYSLIGD